MLVKALEVTAGMRKAGAARTAAQSLSSDCDSEETLSEDRAVEPGSPLFPPPIPYLISVADIRVPCHFFQSYRVSAADNDPPVWTDQLHRLECYPKDFSAADTKHHRKRTKGVVVCMSPCGAKVHYSEMISSESMSRIFHDFSKWVPIVKPQLKEIMKKKMARNATVRNPRTGATGTNSPRFFYPV